MIALAFAYQVGCEDVLDLLPGDGIDEWLVVPPDGLPLGR